MSGQVKRDVKSFGPELQVLQEINTNPFHSSNKRILGSSHTPYTPVPEQPSRCHCKATRKRRDTKERQAVVETSAYSMAGIFEQSREGGSLFLGGQKISGSDIRDQNVLATQAIATIVKSSFGPSGLDKMMVDDIGEVTVTNDGATILGLLSVDHPAGKILVDLANQQDK